ncbi:SDR family NAD(P)-dependent oxidoreductase, partial [Nocardia neocaledoniensis]|uniref:SDR family NAD(P)-dependent oxidoreductase n=1 Tax=Nocardia neocaledoniensis TaxID=236511 RepID=UPI0032AF5F82
MPTDAGGLAGRTVVVTGAGRGLGLAIARRLGAEGVRLWLADIRADWGAGAPPPRAGGGGGGPPGGGGPRPGATGEGEGGPPHPPP